MNRFLNLIADKQITPRDIANFVLAHTDSKTWGLAHRTPLPYYGSKVRMANELRNIFSLIPHDTYVEPFCGAAAAFFAKPIHGNVASLSDQKSMAFICTTCDS